MHKPDRKKVRKALFEVIENQIKMDNPPETKETFHRLRAAGFSRKESMRLLACVLLVEMNDMIKDNRLYDEVSYVNRLKALPEMPWEDEPEEYD